MLQLGLCCLNTVLRKKGIFCSRTLQRASFTVAKAKEKALANLHDAETMMRWNHEHNIHVFRLSSDIFPHFTDPETEPYTMDFAIPTLQHLGNVARECGQRITMHPGQFNQVGTPHARVFQKTIDDLSYHAAILDHMGMDLSSILCIHGGGVYGCKETTMRRWVDQFHDLPFAVRRRLAIENCERQYCLEDVIELSYQCNIPVIFDTHHDQCYRMLHHDYYPEDLIETLPMVVDTWEERTPLMHISEQRPDARIGAHSDKVETIPAYLLELVKQGTSIDLEVEAKLKNEAIDHLYQKYSDVFVFA